MGIFSDANLDFGGGVGLYNPGTVEKWFQGDTTTAAAPITYDWGQYQQGQQQQQALNEMLLARAQGRGGPSVAENQLAQTTAANRAQAFGQAASARGGAMNQASAQRAALYAGANTNQQAAGQGATLRAQEQQAAMNQYQAGLQAQQNAELNRQMGMAQNQVGYLNAQTARQAERNKEENQAKQGMLGMGSSVIMGGLGGSDERMKHDIGPADKMIEDFLSHISSKRYEYNPGMGDGPGMRVGVMAQDLEKSPVGRTLVERGDDGMRYVETQRRLPMLLLAALADVHKRLEGGGL